MQYKIKSDIFIIFLTFIFEMNKVICNKCGIEKEKDDFYPYRPTRCKKCLNSLSVKYSASDKGKATRKKHYYKNIEKMRSQQNKRSKRKTDRQIQNLSEAYILKQLRQSGHGNNKQIKQDKSLIQNQKKQLAIKRIRKTLNKLK